MACYERNRPSAQPNTTKFTYTYTESEASCSAVHESSREGIECSGEGQGNIHK